MNYSRGTHPFWKRKKVDRSNMDPFWTHVEKGIHEGKLVPTCKYCAHPFSENTSIWRIKWHLSRQTGHGVAICTDEVPKYVQEEALQAMSHGNKRQAMSRGIKRQKPIASNGVDNFTGNHREGTEQGVGEGSASSGADAGNNMENVAGKMMPIDRSITAEGITGDAHDTRGEASQAMDLVDNHPGAGVEFSPDTHAQLCDIFRGEMETDEADRVPGWSTEDAPESGQRTGQMGQLLGQSTRMVYGVDNMAGDRGRNRMEVQGMEEGAGDAHETRGEASQAPDTENVTAGLMQLAVGASSSGGLLQPAVGTSSGGLTHSIYETGRYPLTTTSTKIVGLAFEKNKNDIWSWLMDDEVSRVAIYGMGGVGKTTLATQIYNKRLEPESLLDFYWITVKPDWNINTLQNIIARRIGFSLSSEEEELHRAGKLSEEFTNRKKWVLILDNLWDSFELHEVGIPMQVKGCKLILITRSKMVCEGMYCQKKIKVEPLSKGEAWTLFMEKLGNGVALSPEVENIAQFIADECDGLPLGILTMAATMRGKDDVREWRSVWRELKESKVREKDMEPKVFKILRLSYRHLKESSLQQCFLYCSLFPEAFEIDRNDLIGYLIDEGIIKETKGRWAEFDKGHAMLNELLSVCLLERGRNSNNESVRMHDLIRDMALQIQQEIVMVKASVRLKELPNAEEWTENLERVSLMRNQIEEIPLTCSPRCPSVSTLLLCNNELQFIAASFFKGMHRLKVLDLSCTHIKKLPDFDSNLVSLNALLLKSCEKLRHVPSLQKLTTLKRLDLSHTALEKIPQGMECLSNLRYLRLNGCGETEFPSGILPKLPNLQVFVLENNMPSGYASVTVKGTDVARLRKLETLECYFEGYSDFMEYLISRNETESLSRYQIFVGKVDEFCRNKSVGLVNFSINRDRGFQVMFPSDIEELVINNCNDATSLCDVSPSIKDAAKLEVIRIWYCNKMESLVSSAPPPSLSSNVIFYNLKDFRCYRCPSMKKLFPLVLLPNLVNLERISVVHCEKMEEIIATRDEEGVMGEESSSGSSYYSITESNLPKLRSLRLSYLPELKSICSAKLSCDSLEEIMVCDCRKLKRMPICLPLLDNGQPSPPPSLRKMDIYPEEWWEFIVEWEHPNAKHVLGRFVKFW